MENETTLAELIHRGGIFKNVENISVKKLLILLCKSTLFFLTQTNIVSCGIKKLEKH